MDAPKPRRKTDFIVKNMGEAILLYSAKEEIVHILNPIAQLIWELCDGEHTAADIEQTIRANFGVTDEHDIRRDIQRLLDIFANKGLLQQSAS